MGAKRRAQGSLRIGLGGGGRGFAGFVEFDLRKSSRKGANAALREQSAQAVLTRSQGRMHSELAQSRKGAKKTQTIAYRSRLGQKAASYAVEVELGLKWRLRRQPWLAPRVCCPQVESCRESAMMGRAGKSHILSIGTGALSGQARDRLRGDKIMIGAVFSCVLLFGQVPASGAAPDPPALVAQLGAARYADREAATEALVRLGRKALPALRDSRLAADLEIRTRTQGLIRKIEGALLLEPTKVRLDFDDLPLTEIVQALNHQLAFRLSLYPEHLPRWESKRITIHQAEPVDFWKAVDRLCEAGELQYNPMMQAYADQREPNFTLTAAAIHAMTPNSDHGPFRVSLLALHYQRDVNFAGAQPSLTDQFYAQLQVVGEPRLAVQQNGVPRLVEAVDDRGNSLIPSGTDNPAHQQFSGYFGMATGPAVQMTALLHRPDAAGKRIKKLRGVIPVSVSSRQPDPLVVPLQNAAGKTFGGDELQVTVHSIKGLPNNRQSAIELSVKASDDRATATDNLSPQGFNSVMPQISVQQMPIEIVDARGQVLRWVQTHYDAESAHVILTLPIALQAAPLKELRYFTLNRASASIPFEFNDILMP